MRVPSENVVVGWRCFHCNEYFAGVQKAEAAAHFGATIDAEPACKINGHDKGLVGRVREMEGELEIYRAEDTHLHRRVNSLYCEHGESLRHAEEKGYERGIRDSPGAWSTVDKIVPQKIFMLWALTGDMIGGKPNWKMATGYFSPIGTEAERDETGWVWDGRRLRTYDVQPTHFRSLFDPPADVQA